MLILLSSRVVAGCRLLDDDFATTGVFDESVDVYALAVTIHELLTDKTPFEYEEYYQSTVIDEDLPSKLQVSCGWHASDHN